MTVFKKTHYNYFQVGDKEIGKKGDLSSNVLGNNARVTSLYEFFGNVGTSIVCLHPFNVNQFLKRIICYLIINIQKSQ